MSSSQLRDSKSLIQESFSRECEAYAIHINQIFRNQEALKDYIPLCSVDMFEKLRDGVILGNLLNHYFPGSIDTKKLIANLDLNMVNKNQSKVLYEVNDNLELVLKAAKGIKGLVVVNIGPQDFLEMKKDLVLGMIWQIFNLKLIGEINLTAHPELIKLVDKDESLFNLTQLKPEFILIRWVNYHLEASGSERRVKNLGKDLSDCVVYVVLLGQISPDEYKSDIKSMEKLLDFGEKAEAILNFAEKLNCLQFVTAKDILDGHPKLNFAFIATLFNKYIGIHIPSDEELSEKLSIIKNLEMNIENLKITLSDKQVEFDKEVSSNNSRIRNLEKEVAQILQEKKSVENLVEIKLETQKKDLLAKYKENMEEALNGERKLSEEKLLKFLKRENECKKKLLQLNSMIESDIPENDEDIKQKQNSLNLDLDIEEILQKLEFSYKIISRQYLQLKSTECNLKAVIAHKDKVNEIMGSKIREYTELVITGKKTESGRRGSLIKRIFKKQ